MRGLSITSRAGSQRLYSGWHRRCRRCAGLVLAFEGLDNDHMAAAAWAWRSHIIRLDWRIGGGGCRDAKQLANVVEMTFAGGPGEQAVMADAVKALGQDVEQDAADELVCGERHDLLPFNPAAAVVLVAEGDAAVVEADQPAVRDSDSVGVARQVREHRLGSGERRLGVDHSALLPNR